MSDNIIPFSTGPGGPTTGDTGGPATTKELRETIEHMDALSQEAFDQIDAIALLIQQTLKSPEANLPAVQDAIGEAAGTIRGIALDIEDRINSTAERVGCNSKP